MHTRRRGSRAHEAATAGARAELCPSCGVHHPGAGGRRVAHCGGVLRARPRFVLDVGDEADLRLEAHDVALPARHDEGDLYAEAAPA